jgi:phage repressor protein C with HTH and peptisase S24 domain
MANLLCDRIQEIIDSGFSQADLYRAAGVTKGTSNQWLDGKIKSIKLEYAQGIQSLTGFNANWIVTGKGIKKSGEYREEISMENNPDYPAVRRVKLALSAGISGFSVEMEEESHAPLVFGKYWYQSRGYNPENLLAVRVKGDSMEPRMSDSDTVVINTADKTPVDGKVFAVNYEGEAVIKRMVRDAGDWWLSSDNPDQRRYARKLCSGDSCIIIGLIVHHQTEKI